MLFLPCRGVVVRTGYSIGIGAVKLSAFPGSAAATRTPWLPEQLSQIAPPPGTSGGSGLRVPCIRGRLHQLYVMIRHTPYFRKTRTGRMAPGNSILNNESFD